MNLGETIYKLRTKQNLSQGDLADRLTLSRQSVSKWENNSAVPDLDNLIKLSEILGVSLDTLVKGEQPKEENIDSSYASQSSMPQTAQPQAPAFPMKNLIGILLLCMAFVAFLLFAISIDLFNGLLFALPFLICGIICLVCKEHAGLKCGWFLYLCLDLFLRLGSGTKWSIIFSVFRYPVFNLVYIISWVMFLLLVALIVVTIRTYKKKDMTTNGKSRVKLLIFWGLFAVTCVAYILLGSGKVYSYLLEHNRGLLNPWQLLCSLLDYCRIFLFTAALVQTLRYRKSKKDQ